METIEMNWPIIMIVGITVIALIVFLVMRNQKDEKQLEQQIKKESQSTK